MKKITLFILLLCSTFIFAQIVNIPDANFKRILLEASPNNYIAKDLNGHLIKIDANGNGEIEVSEAENVSWLNVSYTATSLQGINSFINLTTFDCQYNDSLTSLDLSGLTNLTSFDCLYNHSLTSLDLSGLTNLTSFDCRSNISLTSLDLSGLINLTSFYCWSNTSLTSLNIKNGKRSGLSWYGNKSIKYICCDEEELDDFIRALKEESINAEVNTYCSFEPAGEKNTISGKVSLDLDANGCDTNDKNLEYIKVKVEDGISTEYTMALENGNYSFYSQKTGNFTLTPIFENPYFTVSPVTVNFIELNQTKTQDFCIKPIANKNDLEVSIVPVDRARPGFNSKYELIYKNKGTTTLSGNVSFSFNDNYSDFVSSSVTPAMNSNGNLSYNFTDLKPFEERKITIELKHNTPTAPTFPLEGGEILNISSIINPITNDETANDNTFNLAQEVVNSFDPNDKTCLQGNSITPDMIGNYVDYQIRFENNGSAEATFIVVKDIIDTNLFDIETLTPTSSSHPYHLTIKNGNVVEFYFEDINLPFAPANTNDPKAQGFVSFKIKTKSSLKLGDVLKNKADIYFDYNKPILTNEEQTKIENLNTEEFTSSDVRFTFSPNPAKDFIKFDNEVKSVQVFDLNGKLVQSSIINGTEMNVSKLQSGTYILKISTENGNITEKLVKN